MSIRIPTAVYRQIAAYAFVEGKVEELIAACDEGDGLHDVAVALRIHRDTLQRCLIATTFAAIGATVACLTDEPGSMRQYTFVTLATLATAASCVAARTFYHHALPILYPIQWMTGAPFLKMT